MIVIPAEQWENGETLQVEFFTAANELIDVYRFVLGTEKIIYPSLLAGQNLSVTDEGDKVIVHGNGFEIPFDKETGLIVNATVGEEVIIEKGPFLNLYVNLNHLTGLKYVKRLTILPLLILIGKRNLLITVNKRTGSVFLLPGLIGK